MGLNYYASSPTVVLPPQQPTYFDQRFNTPAFASNTPTSPSGRIAKYPTPPSLNYQASSSNAVAGRKRSLEDVSIDEAPADGSKVITKPKPEPIMGPGMTLIYPDEPGFAIAAESQTGTWAEVKHEAEEAAKPKERPIAVSRKSQRTATLNQASRSSPPAADSKPVVPSPSTASGFDEKSLAYKATNMTVDDAGHTIHDLTMALGIGWKEIVFNPAKKDGARGWAKYISRHYPLACPQILHESEAHDAYLVYARDVADDKEKYFIFSQDLRSCRLLSASLEGVVRNLTQQPIAYESDVVFARETSTPPPVTSQLSPATNDTEMSIDAPSMLAQSQVVDTAMQM